MCCWNGVPDKVASEFRKWMDGCCSYGVFYPDLQADACNSLGSTWEKIKFKRECEPQNRAHSELNNTSEVCFPTILCLEFPSLAIVIPINSAWEKERRWNAKEVWITLLKVLFLCCRQTYQSSSTELFTEDSCDDLDAWLCSPATVRLSVGRRWRWCN